MKHKFYINAAGKVDRRYQITVTLPSLCEEGQVINIYHRHQSQPDESYVYRDKQWQRIWQP